MAQNLEIIIGTYEEFLVGYKIELLKEDTFSLRQSFATRSHTGSIRCVSTCGKYVASGGADDRIFVYDMKTRKEIQVLTHHNGTVNAITFTPDATHLLSGSDDGQLIAVRTNSWQIDAIWKKAHTGSAITQISCHPSGKLALTLGQDLTLRTWNLIKGRTVYTTNLKSKKSLSTSTPDCVLWSLGGDYFTIAGIRVVEIWSAQTAGMIKDVQCGSKPICVCWITNDDVLIGLEDGKIKILSVDADEEAKIFEAHQQRVKSMSYLHGILVTASSSGEIFVWKVDIENKTINKIATSNIGCRPTCIQLLDLSQFGDDYNVITKNEDEDSLKTTTPGKQNQIQRLNVGSVKIEYEEDNGDDNGRSDKDDNIIKDNSTPSSKKTNLNKKRKNTSTATTADDDVKKDTGNHGSIRTSTEKKIKKDQQESTTKNKHNEKVHRPLVLLANQNRSDNDDDDKSESSESDEHNFVRMKKSSQSKNTKNALKSKKKRKVLKSS